jgi:hypothetical protein
MLRRTLLSTLFTLQVFAQTTHPLTAELQKARLAVTLKEGKLSGPGADLLLRELASAQFFLIGEEHGTAEMPRFTQALLEPAWKSGYRHVGFEVGPFGIATLRTYADIEAQLKRYPWSLPFVSWKEEAALYGAATKMGASIWALDQEFVFAGTQHLERLASMATTDAAREAVSKLLERSRAGDKVLFESRNPGKVFMLSATKEDLGALRAAFTGDAEAVRLIDALEESREIYALNSTSGWESNLERSLLMKRLFMQRYDAAVAKGESRPKVIMKLGATHTMRGRSMTGVFDLGNMLPELAAANGTRSFQLLVLPRGGFTNEYRPHSPDDSGKRAPYDPAKELPFDAKPLFDAAAATEWSLFDLRPLRVPLRRGKLGPLEPRFEDVLWGYDAVLIIPDVTPATLFE